MSNAKRQRKLCILGDFSVGKTSLVRRYTCNEFSDNYVATAGAKIHQHQSKIEVGSEEIEVEQSIWDVEGSQYGEQLVKSYIAGASGALIVGDLTRDDMLASMTSHAEKFLAYRPGRPVVFALNKSDLVAKEERADGAELVRNFGGQVIQTSALTGEEVIAVFHAMYRRILEIGA
ncbi:MAG: Rab family GTPase [Geminicoccales bacterium]